MSGSYTNINIKVIIKLDTGRPDKIVAAPIRKIEGPFVINLFTKPISHDNFTIYSMIL